MISSDSIYQPGAPATEGKGLQYLSLCSGLPGTQTVEARGRRTVFSPALTAVGKQRGAALLTAVFLLTVVALLATLVAFTSVTQHTSAVRAHQTEQAWYAAIARLERDIPDMLANSACPVGETVDLFGYTTTLTCNSTTISEGGEDYRLYHFIVGAARGNRQAATLVRRTVRAQLSDRGN